MATPKIQWLFPMYDEQSNYNPYAVIITQEESEAIRENLVYSMRALSSFETMLNFMGFKLDRDDWTVKVENLSKIRFLNLSQHNFLRITRMFKSMNYIGLGSLKQTFLLALKEQILNSNLDNAYSSFKKYWCSCCDDEVPLFSSAIKLLTFESETTKNYYLSNIALKARCEYSNKLLLHEAKCCLPFDKKEIWLVLGKQDVDKYIVMNKYSGIMKVSSLCKFDYIYSQENNVITCNIVGLYIWDDTIDVTIDEVDSALMQSFLYRESQIKFVYLIRKSQSPVFR